MDYEEYEKQCKEIRAENDNLLKIFEEDLKSKGLSEQTIGRHISNVDFYINEYLLREDARTMEEGVAAIDTFLGYFSFGNVCGPHQGQSKARRQP